MKKTLFEQFMRQPRLPLPDWMNAAETYDFLNSIRVEHGPEAELHGYCRRDWRRFLHTWAMAKDLTGTGLELGANPYFTTILLREFTPLDLRLANYFGHQTSDLARQRVRMMPRGMTDPRWLTLEFHQFNVEGDPFPFADDCFDVVLFCEIIEHMQHDPLRALSEIKRVLKPGGRLILTTPNVARLDNVLRLMAGTNINDRYSGYGPYGRHNREYTRHEIEALLKFCGFHPETIFTADVHFNNRFGFIANTALRLLLGILWWRRAADLGQYIFVRARNAEPMQPSRPDWLFRSFATAAPE